MRDRDLYLVCFAAAFGDDETNDMDKHGITALSRAAASLAVIVYPSKNRPRSYNNPTALFEHVVALYETSVVGKRRC